MARSREPRDARLVGIVGEATGHAALSQMHKRMQCHPVGRRSSTIGRDHGGDTRRLAWPAAGQFWRRVCRLPCRAHVRPRRALRRPVVDDADLAFVMARYPRSMTSHVLYGLPPTMLGEVALKWLEAAQTGLPMAAMAAGGGSLRLKPAERSIVAQHVLPWAPPPSSAAPRRAASTSCASTTSTSSAGRRRLCGRSTHPPVSNGERHVKPATPSRARTPFRRHVGAARVYTREPRSSPTIA